MLSLEHSAILLTCIKLPVVIKIFVLSIFEWPLIRTSISYKREKENVSFSSTHLIKSKVRFYLSYDAQINLKSRVWCEKVKFLPFIHNVVMGVST